MELKVWVEGIQRIVCGVTVNTTCQDVVFALAHATGKVGRFTLIERWRNNERLLAPNENPLKLLLKWGEYANDVQFILQRSENKQQPQHQAQKQRNDTVGHITMNSDNKNDQQTNAVVLNETLRMSNKNSINNNNGNMANNNCSDGHQLQQSNYNKLTKTSFNLGSDKSRELKKSFGAHDVKYNDNVGIVKGIPQRPISTETKITVSSECSPPVAVNIHGQTSPVGHLMPKHEKSHSNPIEMTNNQSHSYSSVNSIEGFKENNNNSNIYNQLGAQNSKSINEINLAAVRNSLDRRTTDESPEIMFTIPQHNNNENLLDVYNGNVKFNDSPDLYKNTPTISANGALVPPPYRDPPPPRNSPLQMSQQQHMLQQPQRMQIDNVSPVVNTNPFLNDYDSNYELELQSKSNDKLTPMTVCNAEENDNNNIQTTQYNDLLQLIKFQREKISTQQMELSKYDAEIVFLEHKERDQAQELEEISREITKVDQVFRQGSDQLQTLQYVEEENELVKQQEKTLKSEIALLRSKLANCETELMQCKNKIRILMDDIEVEQRAITNKQASNRQTIERDFLMEMERIQSEIDQVLHSSDSSSKTAENLKKELILIENAIAEKKRQVEQLVNEMKEVNLQSLTVPTSEEIKHLLDGPNKPGSSRRIIGSPRQLENAVPTSKNPHGVWV